MRTLKLWTLKLRRWYENFIRLQFDMIDTECKPGAVFLVMQKTSKTSPLVFNGTALLYNGSEISGIVDLMQELINNKFAESL